MAKVVDWKKLPTWPAMRQELLKQKRRSAVPIYALKKHRLTVRPELAEKISLWRGDITQLNVDAIVNAANTGLWAGGGVCGAIHRAAGPELARECKQIGHCPVGGTVITKGYRLPAKHVLHSVGPTNGSAEALQSCYQTCLDVSLENKVRSLAFCCIGTGIFGFPNAKAAEIALGTTRAWLEKNGADAIDRVVFCLFLDKDWDLYTSLMPVFFPVEASDNALDGSSSKPSASAAAAEEGKAKAEEESGGDSEGEPGEEGEGAAKEEATASADEDGEPGAQDAEPTTRARMDTQ